MPKDVMARLERLKEIPPWEWPKDARETILAALKLEDAEAREAAAYMASAVVNDPVARVLLEQCKSDAAEAVAGAAAIALGPSLEEAFVEYGDEDPAGLKMDPEMVQFSPEVYTEIRATLRQIFEDQARPKLCRRQVLEAAVRAPLPWQVEAVRAAHQDGDPEWRLTAVFCMAFVEGFDAQILAALEDDDLPTRRAAIMAAGEQELGAAGPLVLALAGDDGVDLDLRVVALEALVGLNPPGSDELLAALVDGDNDDLAEVADEIREQRAMLADLDG